jgi:peptide/nickel transport system permease protein
MTRIGFILFFTVALLSDFIANEKPLYCKIKGQHFFPAFQQKATDWQLIKPDSSLYSQNWLIFNEYESVLKAPIPFSAGSIDSRCGGSIPPFQSTHWLGTDKIGRDVLAGLIHGCNTAFLVGFGVMLLALFIGVLLGGLAASAGGFTDYFINRIIEIKRTIPSVFWVLVLSSFLNKCTILHIILIVGGLVWTDIALLTRATLLKVQTTDYITAAKTLGLSDWEIFFRHALPNSLTPIYVAAPHIVAGAILSESALSFLGIGLSVEEVTWGALLRQGQSDLNAWWLVFFPGLAIFIVILLCNSVGEKWRKESK